MFTFTVRSIHLLTTLLTCGIILLSAILGPIAQIEELKALNIAQLQNRCGIAMNISGLALVYLMKSG